MSGSNADCCIMYIADEKDSQGRMSSYGHASPRVDLEWRVDLSPSLRAMTTAELWAAAATGDVGPETRVWHEGLECWTRLDDIYDVAGALRVRELQLMFELGMASTPTAVEIAPRVILDTGEDRDHPVEWGHRYQADIQRDSLVRARELPSYPLRPALGGIVDRSTERPAYLAGMFSIVDRLRDGLASARWVAAGFAVAAASVGLSLWSIAELLQLPHAHALAPSSSIVDVAMQAPSAFLAHIAQGASERSADSASGEPGQWRRRSGQGVRHGARGSLRSTQK